MSMEIEMHGNGCELYDKIKVYEFGSIIRKHELKGNLL